MDHYHAILRAAEDDSVQGGVERAYQALRSVAEALVPLFGGPVLEALSDEEYQRLREELRGAQIGRELSVYVVPDLEYFTRLATEHGDDGDRAFFRALAFTYPDGIWPVYLEPQTDYSGCTRFGSLSLVETYGAWSEFQRLYPGRYETTVQERLEAVVESLTHSTCACGDLGGVEEELLSFVERFPAAPERTEVEGRLKAIRSGRVRMRENCSSG